MRRICRGMHSPSMGCSRGSARCYEEKSEVDDEHQIKRMAGGSHSRVGRSSLPATRGLRRQQHSKLPGERQGAVVAGAQPISAPRRSHSQPGRDREGLRRPGTAGAGRGDQRASARDPGAAADSAGHRQQSGSVQALPGGAGATHRRARAVLAVSERYPDLKSNQNFLALQSQLEGTENRIAVARRDYIEAVRQYNTELRTFPGVIWASTLYRSNKPMETFTVAEDVRRPPQVKF